MEPTVAGHTTPAGHGRAGGLLRKGTIGPLVDVDAGSATGHGAGTGAFFHRHHRHPPPTGKQLPQRQLHGVPGRRYGGGTTGHAWAGMRGDIQSDACPGHRHERGQDGGPPYRRTSGHARGVHPAVCPRARCGNSKRPGERADYAVCATQGGGDRPPVPSNCGAPICETHAVAAPVRVGAATRDVPPADACPSAHESSGGVVRRPRHRRTGRHHGRTRDEACTRHCGPPSAPRRVRSPTAKGDCGVCLRVSRREGEAAALTDELDAKHQSDLYETLQGPDRKVFVSNTAAGAGRPLTDPQVHADDRGFSTYLRERLLVRVLPEGQKCVCGADASNEHVHTCTRLQQNPRTTRHDMINMTFANGLRLCGFQCGMEPRLTEASRRRPDILIVGLDTYAITDVTVTYAGRVTAYVSEESMEEADPLRAARDRLTQKRQKYRHWALANGLDFEPFVMLTNGAIHPASRRWLRRILGNQDHRLTITNAYDMIVADTLAAMLRGNVHVFNAACGRVGPG
ncbi:putative SLACS reverse transcriptase [Trypanosoma cruzi]|uniref:Putative SLACS reverse transcriptase n=1 Tax=Trypanosoma cruzi TaxID=5693 RepID=A0A2V2UTL3_TRYCR|nr:putative SLACS reverse transcriptase [Trypanosoma cruzi]